MMVELLSVGHKHTGMALLFLHLVASVLTSATKWGVQTEIKRTGVPAQARVIVLKILRRTVLLRNTAAHGKKKLVTKAQRLDFILLVHVPAWHTVHVGSVAMASLAKMEIFHVLSMEA
jgi:hypothetical protein